MVVLKKIKASSLNEVLVATTIIVLIFGIAMAILSNLLKMMANRDQYQQHTILNELMYQYENEKLTVPYFASDAKYQVEIVKEQKQAKNWVSFEITSKRTEKKLIKKLLMDE